MPPTYFDDLHFIAADEAPRCDARIDRRFAGMCNLQYVADGAIYFAVDGGDEQTLPAGSIFWHEPSHTYRYGPAEARASWHHLWVTFTGARARRIMTEGFLTLCDAHWLPADRPVGFRETFAELVARVRRHGPGPDPASAALLETLLASTAEAARAARPIDPREDSLRRLGDAISADPLAEWNFHAQARMAHLSYSHFRRLFARVHGRPPHRFLLAARVRHAADLLATTGLQIKEIAAELDCDPAQFSKLFRRHVGLWPAEFRRNLPTTGPAGNRT